MPIRIRPITRADLVSAAAICHAAFFPDELFVYFYPQRDKYPDDERRYWLLSLRRRMVEQQLGVIAEDENGEIVGVSFWRLRGKNMEKNNLAMRFESYLISWEAWYDRYFLDGGTRYDRIEKFQNAVEYTFYDVLPRFWHMHLLAVHPRHQRKGVGKALVGWGLEKSRQDGVPATLEASESGRKLYAKCGFVVIDRTVVEGLDGVGMVWEPEDKRGQWIERKGDGEDAVLRKELSKETED